MRRYINPVSSSLVAILTGGCAVTSEDHAANGVFAVQLTQADLESADINVYGGRDALPTSDHDDLQIYPIVGKRGHILQYDSALRIPLWSAYKVEPSFRQTPQRTRRFAGFRGDDDPRITDPVVDADYVGLFNEWDLARGHLAPYAVMGGDRNDNGVRAHLIESQSDAFDEQTIFQANMMSNIAPQYHSTFNGRPGIWWCIERWVQDCLVRESERTVWVIAGAIVGPGPTWLVGRDDDIAIPHAFYKIVFIEEPGRDTPIVLAFLTPHHRTAHAQIEDFLVSVDVIEGLSGFDFFTHEDEEIADLVEDTDSYEMWVQLWSLLEQTGECDPDGAEWRPERASVFD